MNIVPSRTELLHILIWEVITNGLWWLVTKMATITSQIRDIGFLIIVVVVFLGVLVYLAYREKQRNQIPQGKPVVNLNNLPITFFEKRPDLQWLLGQVRSARNCWGAWFVGGTVATANIVQHAIFERLILLHPEHPALPIFKDIQPSMDGARLSRLIVEMTMDAEKKGEVRWCPDILYSLITIGNPPARDTDPIPSDAWAMVEVYYPGVDAMDRPSFFVRYEDAPELLKGIVEAYRKLWEHSVKADTSSLTLSH